MSVLIAVPVRNGLDLTQHLVGELVRQGERDRLFVYDNGSTDGTAEWLGKAGIHAVEAEGMTLHEMWNHALDVGRGGHVVILNNDLLLDGKENWIDRLVEPLGGQWDATCPNYDRTPVVKWGPKVRKLYGICANRYDGTGGLAGFAFALSESFLSTGYRFPTDLKWWYGDNDMVMTLEQQGRHYGMVLDVGVTHIGGGSQTAKQHDLREQMREDKLTFEEQWSCTIP